MSLFSIRRPSIEAAYEYRQSELANGEFQWLETLGTSFDTEVDLSKTPQLGNIPESTTSSNSSLPSIPSPPVHHTSQPLSGITFPTTANTKRTEFDFSTICCVARLQPGKSPILPISSSASRLKSDFLSCPGYDSEDMTSTVNPAEFFAPIYPAADAIKDLSDVYVSPEAEQDSGLDEEESEDDDGSGDDDEYLPFARPVTQKRNHPARYSPYPVTITNANGGFRRLKALTREGQRGDSLETSPSCIEEEDGKSLKRNLDSQWKCPHCPYRQLSSRTPDLRRHIKTHTRAIDQEVWVCCGVRIEDRDRFGVSPDAKPIRRGAYLMVGGCGKDFSRRDALKRHIDNVNIKCKGDMSLQPWVRMEGEPVRKLD